MFFYVTLTYLVCFSKKKKKKKKKNNNNNIWYVGSLGAGGACS